MTYQPISSISGVQLRPLLRWPENLEDIKVTDKEKTSLEEKIYEMSAKIIHKEWILIEQRSDLVPRTLIVGSNRCLVVLKGMAPFHVSKDGKKKIKYVWDCISGSWWLKKPFQSSKQHDIIQIWDQRLQDEPPATRGLVEVHIDRRHSIDNPKGRFYEKKAQMSLQTWLTDHRKPFQARSIVGLLSAMKVLHATSYYPPAFMTPKNALITNFTTVDYSHALHYGRIDTSRVVCEEVYDERTGNSYPVLKWTMHGQLGNINLLQWHKGWVSPETIRFVSNKQESDQTSTFISQYGRAKDIWAIGLLICSLLKGWSLDERVDLPAFKFITAHLKCNGEDIDADDLAQLTQKEVDAEIDPLIKQEKDPERKKLWLKGKKCLIVDPAKRPTLDQLLATSFFDFLFDS